MRRIKTNSFRQSCVQGLQLGQWNIHSPHPSPSHPLPGLCSLKFFFFPRGRVGAELSPFVAGLLQKRSKGRRSKNHNHWQLQARIILLSGSRGKRELLSAIFLYIIPEKKNLISHLCISLTYHGLVQLGLLFPSQ